MRVIATAGVPPRHTACPFLPYATLSLPLARSDEQACRTVQNSCNCDGWFGGDCDCDAPDTQRCDPSSCDSSCDRCSYAVCSTGTYGTAVHVTRGPRAVPGPPNTFPTPPRTVHHPTLHARVAGRPSICNRSPATGNTGCSPCNNKPANSAYVYTSGYNGGQTGMTCPYVCSAGFYRSGSSCPACTTCSGTSSYQVSDCQAGGESNNRVCAPPPPSPPPPTPPPPSPPPSSPIPKVDHARDVL